MPAAVASWAELGRSQLRGQEGQPAAGSLAAGRASLGGDCDSYLSSVGGTAAVAAVYIAVAAEQRREEVAVREAAGRAAPVAARSDSGTRCSLCQRVLSAARPPRLLDVQPRTYQTAQEKIAQTNCQQTCATCST